MAIATAVSAAAMAIPNRLKKCPSRCPGKRYLLNTAKLMFVALSISSAEMSSASRFLRVKKPYIPQNSITVLITR